MKRREYLFSLTLLAAFSFNSSAVAASYSFTELRPQPNYNGSGSAINNAGQVLFNNGGSYLYDAMTHDLTLLPFGAVNVNDMGITAGVASVNSLRHASFFDGTLQDIGTLGGAESIARGINTNNGKVVGVSDTASGRTHAFLYDGTMLDIGTLGGSVAQAYAINDGDQVAGWSSTPGETYHAFIYDGTMHDLGTLNGPYSYGYAINSTGQVAGESSADPGNFAKHAFLYDGTMHDLGTLGGANSHAYGINDTGQVTGASEIPGGSAQHAFIYDNIHGMRDLNSLIDPTAGGWTLTSAADINNAGQITGTASRTVIVDDQYLMFQDTAFLLTPIPEPSTFALAALGILGAMAYARLRRVY